VGSRAPLAGGSHAMIDFAGLILMALALLVVAYIWFTR
jgi:hypothetical protein